MELYKHSYHTTALEDWVSNLYIRLRITHPKQIDIKYIARIYTIFVKRKPIPAFHEVLGRYRGITLDSRESKEIQKEMFFHEWSHILRHSGNQTMMPAAFRELQEWDARHFTRYAAIPSHMLRFIDLQDEYVIDQMVSLFKVSPELCEERLEQIKNRCLQHSFVAETRYLYGNN